MINYDEVIKKEMVCFKMLENDNKSLYDRGIKAVELLKNDETLTPLNRCLLIFEATKLYSKHIRNHDENWFPKWMDDAYNYLIVSGKMTLSEVNEERKLAGV